MVNPGRMFYQPSSRIVKPALVLVEWAHPNTNATVGAGFTPIFPALFHRQRILPNTKQLLISYSARLSLGIAGHILSILQCILDVQTMTYLCWFAYQ